MTVTVINTQNHLQLCKYKHRESRETVVPKA